MLFILLQAEVLSAQSEEVLQAARYLSGASSDEEADEFWISRLETLEGRKIRINAASVRSEGILSDYLTASLADYRSRSGDILSWEELALVDGFSQELVAVLKPFLSLESARLPGDTDTVRVVKRLRSIYRNGDGTVPGDVQNKTDAAHICHHV